MKSVLLSIPEPCHEDWQNMTPTDQGRFCNSCAKQVVDFSMMSDQEVLHYFSGIKNENVCGRALPAQLNRTIMMRKEPRKRLFWYWNYIVMFFMFFSKSNNTKAQGGISVVTQCEAKIKTPLKGRVGETRNGEHMIRGQIIDGAGVPVSFATVKIMSSASGVSADIAGKFSLTTSNIKCTLQVSALGYEEKLLLVNDLTEQNVVLKKSTALMKEVVVSSNTDRYMMGAMTSVRWTRTIITTKVKDSIETSINVYPNPVRRGNIFFIDLKLRAQGNYDIQVSDVQSRVLLQRQVNTISKDHLEKIQADS